MLKVIEDRRSIRKYTEQSVAKCDIEEILRAGQLAPSSKNRQPWHFVVATGESKAAAVDSMRRGLERELSDPLLPKSARYLSGAKYTLYILDQAPVLIFAVNPLAADIHKDLDPEARIYEICNAQSIGAAMENMMLMATSLGLGSLWMCDSFFAQDELNAWLHTEGELYAVMAVGFAAETPAARPRREMSEIVEWRT